MNGESLVSFAEAFKSNKCQVNYLDLGNNPSMTDQSIINFCETLCKRVETRIWLETLILRGNSNLKITAGSALEKFGAVQ